MARFNSKTGVAAIYDAVSAWRDRCLLSEGSVFSDATLWTVPVLDELDRYFVRNPDEGEGDFLSKLNAQLTNASLPARQLMAEHLWLLLLFPSTISPSKKRENILTIWSWSGTELPSDHPMLADNILGGIGSAGTGYNTNRWRELVFLINAVRDFKRISPAERQALVDDAWAFSSRLRALPDARKRQLSHILPHLMFPDSFERMSTESDKRLILAGYGEGREKDIRKWNPDDIDRALLALRQRLESEQGTKDLDFYDDEFLKAWKQSSRTWLLSWNPTNWAWDTLSADRLTTLGGGKAPASWRCHSTHPKEGDRVFLVRTGAAPKGIVASGKVTRASYEALHWDKARAETGETTRFIDVDFDAIRDPTVDETVQVERLEELEPSQEWRPQSSGIEIKDRPARTLERLWKALPAIGTVLTESTPSTSAPAAFPLLPRNLILYGPPGTGKTYRLMAELAPYRQNGDTRFEFVTFHQNYAYEDFIEGIRPVTNGGNVTYEVRPGVLKRLCERARRAPEKRFLLCIDEINRGNVAKIFGELISLIEVDKRIRTDASGRRVAGCKGLEVTLPHSGEPFGVPDNVDVIATMNTADRSIALLDSAFRRRFQFEELTPKPELLGTIDDDIGNPIDLRQLLEVINARLTRLLHHDQTLGHSYFYKVKSFSDLKAVFAREILPALQEAFYDDWRQIRLVLADQTVDEEDQFVRVRQRSATQLFPRAGMAEVGDGEVFEVVREVDITADAIRKIYEPPE